jgi:hypothetical protein
MNWKSEEDPHSWMRAPAPLCKDPSSGIETRKASESIQNGISPDLGSRITGLLLISEAAFLN